MRTGYFNDQAREYVITDMYPRRKLLNYLKHTRYSIT